MADHYRLRLFKEAMAERIRPGCIVMDLGAGTGVLTRLAFSLGASRVVAVEQNPGMFLWNQKLRYMKNQGILDVVEENSLEWDGACYGNVIDVIVSETIGTVGVNEGILPTLSDAKQRFLKDGGALIPTEVGVQLYLVPSEEFNNLEPRVVFDFQRGACSALQLKAGLSYVTGTAYRTRRTAEILVPSGSWDLLIAPTAKLSATIQFDYENEPGSFGIAIIPLPPRDQSDRLSATFITTRTAALAEIKFNGQSKYCRSFKWQF